MKIRIQSKRGFITTVVLLALAAWALVLLNLDSTRSYGLNERLKLYEQNNRSYLSEKYADKIEEIK
ncbi:MAG: hypothetical protein CMO69_03185 [Verrucomicrobiales bacterium]|jgi:hypothetical protein|nr:hypothetical protein [Verrucomicrobiales bacterium]|tara:strand:+ start:133 stop:330 length:198 start_codon:yes stop_codon:yes gene_type:complete